MVLRCSPVSDLLLPTSAHRFFKPFCMIVPQDLGGYSSGDSEDEDENQAAGTNMATESSGVAAPAAGGVWLLPPTTRARDSKCSVVI